MKALRWAGAAILVLIGAPLVVIGAIGLGDETGRVFFTIGVLVLISAVGGVARLLADRRPPPRPRLVELTPEESALFLPRASAPSRISSMVLLGYGLVLLASAVSASLVESWGVAVVCALLGLAALWLAAPGRDLAGGIWLSPRRLAHEHDGRRWEVPWDDVTGVVPQQPMPVLVRADRMPTVQRTGPLGRAWNPRRGDGLLAVDTRHLAGGTELASYVIGKAVTDPASRTVLGTPDSLPQH
ncbi:hypothetical protein [Nocardioides sp.]|uniref:hypothetical protein n=1 Tax=Nocardioides sp. TaxID=35761 RepID=UPI002ED03B1E